MAYSYECSFGLHLVFNKVSKPNPGKPTKNNDCMEEPRPTPQTLFVVQRGWILMDSCG